MNHFTGWQSVARAYTAALLVCSALTHNHMKSAVMLGRTFLALGLFWLAMPASALTIYKYTDANGVVTYSDQAAPGARVFTFSDRMVEKLDTQVKLETRKHAGGDAVR